MAEPTAGIREWIATVGSGRIDKALAGVWPDLSRTALCRAIEEGRVVVDGEQVPPSRKLKGGERIRFEPEVARPSGLEPSHLALEVVYEDEHLIVVNKPSGLVVHPGAGTGGDTLVHRLLAHCAGGLSGIGGVERPGIVHRLDRETSGVLVAAKHDAAHLKLARAFHDRKVRKLYGVLVKGEPAAESGTWDGAIARHPSHRHRMTVVNEGGRASLTLWKVRERFPGHAWIDCDLKTGRTHQIRVHCQHARLQVMGDQVYGWREERLLKLQPERVMLHAHEIEFKHPMTGRALVCTAPWPQDFLSQVAQLRKGGGR